jgi:hypothetical protein
LRYADGRAKLVRANPIRRVGQKPKSGHPLIQRCVN